MTDNTWKLYALVALVVGLLLFALVLRPGGAPGPVHLSYSGFKEMVRDGGVEAVTLKGHEATVTLNEPVAMGVGERVSDRAVTRIPEMDDAGLLTLLEEHGVVIESVPAEGGSANWLLAFLPWVVILGVYLWFQSRLYGNLSNRFGGGFPGELPGGGAKKLAKSDPRTTFADVAGQDAAKREVAELVNFLKNPKMYWDLGAEPPRGVLLMGPPGTGKTLLARALAGEAGVPFFHVSASEFIEMFVGVGASRVRKLFNEAKKEAPSIVFIDELDAVGRVRGAGFGGGHDEREQTLNQILSELDGFSGREAVIVLAATNRPDVLDPALLRPGRFDRHVTLELPDRDARAAILAVHTRKVPVADDVDLKTIAAGTPGFSGADLKNLVNEAAMAAAREGAKQVTMRHLDEMRDKVIMGSVRTMAIQPDERHRLAVHEAGHTAVAYYLPNADTLYKVTIIPRGRSLGSTHMLPEEERHTLPSEYLEDRLAVMLGGRTAEKIWLGSVSSGADDDIRQATKLARAMVARWGMAEEVGPVDLRQSDDHPFLGRELAQPRHFSEASAERVDVAVTALLNTASERAEAVLRAHDTDVLRLIAALEREETLGEAEIRGALGAGGQNRSQGSAVGERETTAPPVPVALSDRREGSAPSC